MKPSSRSPWWKVGSCALLLLTQLILSTPIEARGGGGGGRGGSGMRGGGMRGGGGRGSMQRGGARSGMRSGARPSAAGRAGRGGQGRYSGRSYNRGTNRGYNRGYGGRGYYGRGYYGRGYRPYYGGWGYGGWGWGGWGYGGYWWPWALGGGLLLGSGLTYAAMENSQNYDWNDIYQQGYQHGYLSGTQTAAGGGGAWCDSQRCYGSGAPLSSAGDQLPSQQNRPDSTQIPGVTVPLWEPPPPFMP